jgi:hypothetical protein
LILSLILENNTFHLDVEFYKQIKGTAMGTKMAPTYSIWLWDILKKCCIKKLKRK